MIRKLLKLASWTALVVGLVMTGKLHLEEDSLLAPPPPFELTRLSLTSDEASVDLTARSDGEVPLAIAIDVPDDTAAIFAEQWLANDRAGARSRVTLTVRRAGAEAEPAWTVASSDFDGLDSIVSASESLLVVARSKMKAVEDTSYTLESHVEARDGLLDDFDAYLLVGEHRDEEIRIARRDKAPGIILLLGAAGVFVHLFFVWIRLVVPVRDALPPDDELPA